MISGTDFTIEKPEFVARACRGLRKRVTTPSEIAEFVAKCRDQQALCLACEDGMMVVDLRPHDEAIEMFVLALVAFKHGFYERQHAAAQDIARDLGASQIAFQSRRNGWGRRLGPEWSRRGSDEFVRSV
jgi:hypothetical protein